MRMRNDLFRGALLWLSLIAPALAADNAIVATPGSGVTIRSKDIGGGVQQPQNGLGDLSGNSILANTPLTAATAKATDGWLPGCRYTSTVPALTDTQQAAAQFDANCRLLVKDDTIQTPSANFTRSANTTAYQIGQIVANSGSAAPMSFTVNTASGRAVAIERAIIKKSTTGVTAPNFRLHLYTASPTIANNDNGTYSTTQSGHFCDIDVNMPTTVLFSDANDGIGAPNIGTRCSVVPTAQAIFGLIEARGAYAPGNAEVFTVTLESHEP